MSDRIERGRLIVIGYIVALLTISFCVIAFYVLVIGPQKLPAQVIRFALTLALCIGLYHGSSVAKWILIVLLGLGGLLALVPVATGDPFAIALGLILAVVYLSFAVVMLASKSVKAFLVHQRGKATTSA